MGRLSQEWLTLQGSFTTDDGTYRESYVWASSIVWRDLPQEFNGIVGATKYRYTIEKQKHKNNPDALKTPYRKFDNYTNSETRLDPAMTLYSIMT